MKRKLLLFIISVLTITSTVSVSFAKNVVVSSDSQSYNDKTKTVTFDGNVRATYDNITVKSPKATVKTGVDGKPETAIFLNNPVAVKDTGNSKSEVKSRIIRLSLLENIATAEGEVNSTITENGQTIVTVKSHTQDFDLSNNILVAKGNVIIDYKDINTRSTEAQVTINQAGKPTKVELMGAVKITQGKSLINAANVIYNPVTEELVAQGNVNSETVLEDQSKVVILSDYQEYDKKSGTLMTSGRVNINYKDYKASGPKANFIPDKGSSKPNKIIFLGRSKIIEGSRQVEADKIEITVNPKNFLAVGNVKSQFAQVQAVDKSKKNRSKKSKPSTEIKKQEKQVKNSTQKSPEMEEIKIQEQIQVLNQESKTE